MPERFKNEMESSRFVVGLVRLRTLTAIRWFGIAGQAAALFFVYFVLMFSLPFGFCLMLIGASIWVNLFAILRYEPTTVLSDSEVAGYLVFDSVQLAAMLFLTGGLQNPFSLLLLVPATVAAGVCPRRLALWVIALVLGLISFVAMVHYPLPWHSNEEINLPPLYDFGIWVGLVLTLVFAGTYMRRLARGNGRMNAALSETQLVLAREERLVALGGLAAAAAHELGTPLSTIQVVAKEMQRELKEGELAEDASLLVSQAVRCREILARLSEKAEAGGASQRVASLRAVLDEAAAPCLARRDLTLLYAFPGGDKFRDLDGLTYRPELIYGLRNLIENAARYATQVVTIEANWTAEELVVSILDDGPGFSADMLLRLGEPYVGSSRKSRWDIVRRVRADASANANVIEGGLGLGFFIAKTLLARTGAVIAHGNRPRSVTRERQHVPTGAWVRIAWPLANLCSAPSQ